MTELDLLADLHKNNPRQGPGSDAVTEQALSLARLDDTSPLQIADIGCGTGASTLLLARLLNAEVTAVDFLPAFIEVLQERAEGLGLKDKIQPLVCAMEELPFADDSLDAIWSEGAIYNIGFEKGVKNWRRFLKPGGLLAVSEITWLTDKRPAAIENYWQQVYPQIDTASAKMAQLEKAGFSPIGYFALPQDCWLNHYYQPLEEGFAGFLARNGHSRDAGAIVAEEEQEIALYRQYQAYYSYGFYLARKV